MFEKIKEFFTKLLLDFRNRKINAKKAQMLDGLNLESKSDKNTLKEFQEQGLTQSEAEKKLDDIRQSIENAFDISPLQEIGKNYAEYYNDGQKAIKKLLDEKQGQVAGAFYRNDLGEIDLVLGKSSGVDDKNAYGLAHILDKHSDEFAEFGECNKSEQLINALNKIVAKGEISTQGSNKINIQHKGFLVGLNKGFNRQGEG